LQGCSEMPSISDFTPKQTKSFSPRGMRGRKWLSAGKGGQSDLNTP
jgi:hypothetical protein